MPVEPCIVAIRTLESDVADKSKHITITLSDLQTPNNYFEYINPDIKIHPFMDIDTNEEHNDFMNKHEFKDVVNRIEKRIINKYPNLSLLNASHYESEKWEKNKKTNYQLTMTKREPKISFRITDHTKFTNGIKECKEYCMNTWKNEIIECLEQDAKYVSFDGAVYRGGCGGKMSCLNSYKHHQQKTRKRELVNGEEEHTFIHYMWGDEEYIKPTEQLKPKIVKKVKIVKKLKIVKEQGEQKTQGTIIDKEIKYTTPDNKDVNKFWDYVSLIDKSVFVSREKWFEFTLAHVNLLGYGDYQNYDNYCKEIPNYDELCNLGKYEELYTKKDEREDKIGWKYIYNLSYENNPDEKVKLDCIYREKFNIFTLLKCKSKVESNDDLNKKLEELEDNDELKACVKNKRIKELKKEIKKQKEEKQQLQYKEMKKYFELYYFKLYSPFVYCKITNDDRVVEMIKKNNFVDLHQNIKLDEKTPFTQLWMDDTAIKTYNSVDFLPYGMECPKDTFNLFTGFQAEKIRTNETGSIEYILDSLKLNAGEDENMYEYLLNYVAHLIQKPSYLPEVALVIMGEQGTGKTQFWENLGNKILGNRYLLQTSNSDDIVGRFNINNNKLLVIMEETEGKNTFMAHSQIKTLITQPDKIWEQKGRDKIRIRNCSRSIFISNNKTPVKVEQTDRRFVITECSNKHRQDREYFSKVMEEWNNPVSVKTLYKFFMNRDISNFNAARDRVISETYKDLQQVTTPSLALYFEYKYNILKSNQKQDEYRNGIIDESFMKVDKMANKLFSSYIKFLQEHNFKHDTITSTHFGREVKKYKGVIREHTRIGNKYTLDYEAIYQYLIEKNYIEPPDENIEVVIEESDEDINF